MEPAYAEHVPIYVHTYSLDALLLSMQYQSLMEIWPDSLPAWESGLRDYTESLTCGTVLFTEHSQALLLNYASLAR